MRFTTSQSPRVFGAVGMRLRLYFGREIELQIARICRCEIPSSAPGPRSCERGEDGRGRGGEAQVRLQRGRARVSAERPRVAIAFVISALASTGPRSCERGEFP